MVNDYVGQIADRIKNEVPVQLRPEQAEVTRLYRVYAVLVLGKGTSTSAEDVHNAWVAWMGEVDPSHPALRPYDALSRGERNQDEPFVEAIRRVSRVLSREANYIE